MELATLLLFSFLLGYQFFLHFSHPEKKKCKLPTIKIKNFEFLPNVRIHFRSKTYHIHHWVNLSVVFILSYFAYDNFQHVNLIRGVAFGGLVQGLRYPDRFKFRLPRNK